jgi:hypothetical protein
MKGLKNSRSQRAKGGKGPSLAVDLKTLLKARKVLRACKGNRVTKLSIWAGSLVAFWGCFRLKELCSGNRHSFDKYSDLLWADVTFTKDSVQIRVKSGKTQGSKPIFVRLWKIDSKILCPRRALLKLAHLQKRKGLFAKTMPVFRRGGGENVRPQDLVKLLNETHPVGGRFTGKGFRSGVPSLLAASGQFGPMDMQHFGRWHSNAYLNYVRGKWDSKTLYQRVAEFILTL